MEKERFCGFVLPLEKIAARSATFYLWIETILEHGKKCRNNWNILNGKLRKKLSVLMLPKNYWKRIKSLVKPIGYDILAWSSFIGKKYYCDLDKLFDPRIVRHFRLTWFGAIDYRRTAEGLVHCEMFSVWVRFRIACRYCLEDEIRHLWQALPAGRNAFFTDPFRVLKDTKMEDYWFYVLREEGTNLEQLLEEESMSPLAFHRHAFKHSAISGNKSAAQFFFQKLTREERDILLLLETVESVVSDKLECSSADSAETKYADVLCYLLSLMSPEQQMYLFEHYTLAVLTTFLNWRCHYLFSDVASLCWSFLHETWYRPLLIKMHETIKKLKYYIPNIFQAFFMHSPDAFKRAFVGLERFCGAFLEEFLLAQDTETIQVIFRSIESADRVRLVFSWPVFQLLNDNILRGRWNVVKACIREASLTKDDQKMLRGSFMECDTRKAAGERMDWMTHKRIKFFEFLDDTEKYVAEDETFPLTKKVRSGVENGSQSKY